MLRRSRAARKTNHAEGRDKTNGKESSQGQEEGRQEAVSRLARKKEKGAVIRPFFLVRRSALGAVPNQHPLDHITQDHLIQHVPTTDDPAEDGVETVQMRLRR